MTPWRIAELPEIFRDVFVRCEIEEAEMLEVARELGIPINTGYTRLHLARALPGGVGEVSGEAADPEG